MKDPPRAPSTLAITNRQTCPRMHSGSICSYSHKENQLPTLDARTSSGYCITDVHIGDPVSSVLVATLFFFQLPYGHQINCKPPRSSVLYIGNPFVYSSLTDKSKSSHNRQAPVLLFINRRSISHITNGVSREVFAMISRRVHDSTT